jgi:hypothetical protein
MYLPHNRKKKIKPLFSLMVKNVSSMQKLWVDPQVYCKLEKEKKEI